MDNAQWLVWLDNEIWKRVRDSNTGMPFMQEKRKLTAEELEHLKTVAHSHEFIVEPHNGLMGFGFGLTFHSLGCFPGVPPTPIFCVNSTHLPEYSGNGRHFDLGWETLSPLSHNPVNAQLLGYYGFEGLREKERYDY